MTAFAPRERVPLAPLTTLGVGGPARWFVTATTAADVRASHEWCRERGVPMWVLGGGSNVVVADAGFDGLVLQVAIARLARRRAEATSCSWTRARASRGTPSWRAWWPTAGPASSVCRAFPGTRRRHADPERRRLRTGGRRRSSRRVQVFDRRQRRAGEPGRRRAAGSAYRSQPVQGRATPGASSSAACGSG